MSELDPITGQRLERVDVRCMNGDCASFDEPTQLDTIPGIAILCGQCGQLIRAASTTSDLIPPEGWTPDE